VSKKIYANLGIDPDIYTSFKNICDEKGLKYGKQIELLMKRFITDNRTKV